MIVQERKEKSRIQRERSGSKGKSHGQGRRLHVAHFKNTLAAQSWP